MPPCLQQLIAFEYEYWFGCTLFVCMRLSMSKPACHWPDRKHAEMAAEYAKASKMLACSISLATSGEVGGSGAHASG